jgi:plasmid stability protein
MPQLLVRNLEEALVRKLKKRAAARGVSAEEEHRNILRDALNSSPARKPTLMQFLLSDEGVVHPDVELDITRSRRRNEARKVEF